MNYKQDVGAAECYPVSDCLPVINTTCRLSCGLMIATICNNFVSAFVWGVCFSKVQSFKGENGCKVLISVISIALQTLNILL